MSRTVEERNLADLILRPLITEKATLGMENNHYTFEVVLKATKPQIKLAIEQLFDVKVLKVNTSVKARKQKRVGRFIGYKPQYKRAIVTLAEGDSIPLFPDV